MDRGGAGAGAGRGGGAHVMRRTRMSLKALMILKERIRVVELPMPISKAASKGKAPRKSGRNHERR